MIDLCVPAGFPSPAEDYAEERINLNNFLITHPEATFIVRCEGESMVQAFIPPKCYLVVDRALTARDGDIVLACIDGQFTVKYMRIEGGHCRLVPANDNYEAIEVGPDRPAIIWGVVSSIIIHPKEIRHVRAR